MVIYSTMNLPYPSQNSINKTIYQTTCPISHFENELKTFFQVQNVKTFVNCFTLSALALRFLTLGRAKTVLTSALCYRRTEDIIAWADLKVKLIDNDLANYSICPHILEIYLKNNNVGVVLAQHAMVKLLDYEKIQKICSKYKVPILFDSVEATSRPKKPTNVGANGHFEIFSLHPSKVINACEGGIITSNNTTLFNQFLKFINMLTNGNQEMFRIEESHAAFGTASLQDYDFWRDIFFEQHFEYKKKLPKNNIFKIVDYEDNKWNPNYKTTLLEISDSNKRDSLIQFLDKKRIALRRMYHPFKHINDSKFPNAKKLSEVLCFLPMGSTILDNGQREVIENLKEFLDVEN